MSVRPGTKSPQPILILIRVPPLETFCALIAIAPDAPPLGTPVASSGSQRLGAKKKAKAAKKGRAIKKVRKRKSTKRYKGGWAGGSSGPRKGNGGDAPSKRAGGEKRDLTKKAFGYAPQEKGGGQRLGAKKKAKAAKKGRAIKKVRKRKSTKRYKGGWAGGGSGPRKGNGGDAPSKRAGGAKRDSPKKAFGYAPREKRIGSHVDLSVGPHGPKAQPGLDELSSPPPRGEAESPQQPATRTVEGTPQMEIRKEMVPAKIYRLAVFVDQGPAAQGADVQQVKIEIPKDMQQIPVDVWLDCSSHFSVDEIEDPPRITVKTATGISDELSFTLNVLKAPDDRPMFVSAFFRYNGRPCGKIARYLELANGSLRWKEFVQSGETEGEVTLPNADALPSIVVETRAKPAEIRIDVLQTEFKDGRNYTLKCDTPQQSWKGLWILPEVTKVLVNSYMQGFMANKGKARIASLKGAGLDFWDLLPEEVKALLWNALEKGVSTMSVISQEPYIPWELMVPYQKVRNPRKPLGVELQLGRWITGDYKSAPQRIPMNNAYVICPKTSGLASAGQEVTFLTQLKPKFDPVTQVTPATFEGVDEGLAGPPRNVIHIICHGKSAVLQTLELDKPDTLDCSQVRTLEGFQAAFKDGPVAFLNACQVGAQVLTLDGLGGFANSFIDLGASAVVAPLWPVQDKAALNVTKTFYRQALKGVPFAKIMKEIRTKAYTQAIDSYAAYCFYGDPMASTS
jgi:hypothetical protein